VNLEELRYDLDSAVEQAEYEVRFRRREVAKYRGVKGSSVMVAHNQYHADRLDSTIREIKANLKRLDGKSGKYIE